jgi:hypothetical protein
MPKNATFRIIGLLLILIALLSFLFSIVAYSKEFYFWANFFLSSSTTLLGIFVTVNVIQCSLDRYHEQEKDAVRRVAARRFMKTILDVFVTLKRARMAAISEPPFNRDVEVDDFLSDDFFRDLKFLDLTKDAWHIFGNKRLTWFGDFERVFRLVAKEADIFIDHFGANFDSEIVDHIETLRNPIFYDRIIWFSGPSGGLSDPFGGSVCPHHASNLFVIEDFADKLRHDCKNIIWLYKELIKYHNPRFDFKYKEPDHPGCSPPYGSARRDPFENVEYARDKNKRKVLRHVSTLK